VIEFVKAEFDIEYTQGGMRDVLYKLGYEYKKPKLVPGNPDEEAQAVFAGNMKHLCYQNLRIQKSFLLMQYTLSIIR